MGRNTAGSLLTRRVAQVSPPDIMPKKEEEPQQEPIKGKSQPDGVRDPGPAALAPGGGGGQVVFDREAQLEQQLKEAQAKLEHQQELAKARKKRYRSSKGGREHHAKYMRGWRARNRQYPV